MVRSKTEAVRREMREKAIVRFWLVGLRLLIFHELQSLIRHMLLTLPVIFGGDTRSVMCSTSVLVHTKRFFVVRFAAIVFFCALVHFYGGSTRTTALKKKRFFYFDRILLCSVKVKDGTTPDWRRVGTVLLIVR